LLAVACAPETHAPTKNPIRLASVALSPAEPTVLDPISVALGGVVGVAVEDAEIHIQWFVDEAEVSTSQELAAGTAAYLQQVHAVVRISDGKDLSSPVLSDTLTIGNAEPQVDSIILSPAEVFTDDTVTAAYTSFDPDGQALSLVAYDWRVNGESVLSSAEPSLDGASYFGRGDQISVNITVSDGVTESEAESEALEVSDTAGEAPEVGIEAEQTRPTEDIVCQILSAPTDIDTDSEPSYAFVWSVDGKLHEGELLSTHRVGDTLPSTATASEQVWTCELVATLDGTELSATASTEIVHLRPDDAPDWRIFAISGHCADCDNLNEDYLDTDEDDTLALLHSTMEAYGFTVESFAYVDEFYNRDSRKGTYFEVEGLPGHGDPEPTGAGVPDRWGFIQILADMETIRDEWQADFVDPTRVMFIAHSHGDVWAHQAFRTVEDLDIELAIDLDGYSMNWESEAWPSDFGDNWQEVIEFYNDAYGTDLFAEASTDWYVDGVGFEDVEDVLPQDNVAICLEVQASEEWSLSAGWINDDDDNHRPDGSSTGVTTYYASSQTHSEVSEPDGEGVLWVLTQLDELYGVAD
jgi:hypothetical protein